MTAPSDDDLRPLLKKARSLDYDRSPDAEVVALFDRNSGEMLAGPQVVVNSVVDWQQAGIEIKASGYFVSYNDLRQSFAVSIRQEERIRRKREKER